MIEFNVRIDFFRDLKDGPKGYVGSALRDDLRALVLPRVGEYVHGLGPASVWHGPEGRTGGPYSGVAAIEHAPVPAFKADPLTAKEQPRPLPWSYGRCGQATGRAPASAFYATTTRRAGSCTSSATTLPSRRSPASR
jgi:hypothetical protein